MDGESPDSSRDIRPQAGVGLDGPGWGDNDDILDDLAAGSVGLSAHGGGGASHVSAAAASAGRVPSIVGGGISGEISVSTACSVVATGNYFDETARRSCRVISARKVVCLKDKRGAQGLRDYSRHHAAATSALPDLFGAAKHFRTKNVD
jgi:hypothetical protein